ncbi:MAG: hypothetical protein ACKO2V_07770 [Snowella sp.]
MMRFEPTPEPSEFDEKCRKKGNAWLAKNSDKKRPRDYWSPFKRDLANGFRNLCGYSAMFDITATVDHFLSCTNHRHLAYEWSNYRYVTGWINSSKKNLDDQILDPFEVEDNWFEIILPSLQLVLTDQVPQSHRTKAEFTLKRLGLDRDERVMRQREEWFNMYQNGEISFEGLAKKAPLIARAIAKQNSPDSG